MITLIAAVDKNLAIAKNGQIPWKLPADMRHFRNTTEGNAVLIGRKTYQSLPVEFKPLPKRWNIVLTHNRCFDAPGCTVLLKVEDVLQIANTVEVFVIGGAEIYRLLLPHAERMILTHVETLVHGDTFFPRIKGDWKPRLLSDHPADEKNPFSFAIVEYSK